MPSPEGELTVAGPDPLLRERYQVATGDRVAIFAANRWDWVVSFWAIAAAGAIPAPMNGWWTAEEYRHAVCAVVVPAPGACPTEEQLAQWCRGQLAGYKVPTRWYLVPGPLPRTASGKLVKRALREWIYSGMSRFG